MGWITQISRASVQAASRRQTLRVAIRKLEAFAVPSGEAPIGRVVVARGRFASQAAAAEARMPFVFRPFVGRLEQYAAPNTNPPVGQLALVHGQGDALAAAIKARMPFIFRRFLGRPPFSLGPPPPPFPGPLGGIAPLLNRDPVQDVRLRRFTEILSSMYNSLSRRGYIRQDSPGQWSLQTGAFQAMRAPGVNDDETANVLPGMTWINTATGEVYINVSNAVGAADWMQVGGGGGSGLSGVFP